MTDRKRPTVFGITNLSTGGKQMTMMRQWNRYRRHRPLALAVCVLAALLAVGLISPPDKAVLLDLLSLHLALLDDR